MIETLKLKKTENERISSHYLFRSYVSCFVFNPMNKTTTITRAFAVLSEDEHGKTIWTFESEEKAREFYERLKLALEK